MKIGFTTTSFRQIKNKEKIVAIAKAAGADCIEWGADVHVKNQEDAVFVKKLCEKHGIEISSYGSYFRVGKTSPDEWEEICKIASLMGAATVRVWLGTKDSEKTDAATYTFLVNDLKFMCDIAEKYNLFVSPECHDKTFNNNTDAFLRIKEDVGKENFRTYFQSRYKKKDYDKDRIKRTLRYTDNVHISFSEQIREQFPLLKPTYIDELLDTLTEEGFDGNYLIEYTYISMQIGFPAAMKKDIKRLREKLEERK